MLLTGYAIPIPLTRILRYIDGRAASNAGTGSALGPGPGDQFVGTQGVDDLAGVDIAAGDPFAAVGLPVELAGRVGVGIDGETAACFEGEAEQAHGRVEPLRTGVDLDGDVVGSAGIEDPCGVELRLGPD